jgi:hypothetical protein
MTGQNPVMLTFIITTARVEVYDEVRIDDARREPMYPQANLKIILLAADADILGKF